MNRYSLSERRLARRIIVAKDDRIAAEADFMTTARTPQVRFLRIGWFLMAVIAYARVLWMSARLAESTRRQQESAIEAFLKTPLPTPEAASRN